MIPNTPSESSHWREKPRPKTNKMLQSDQEIQPGHRNNTLDMLWQARQRIEECFKTHSIYQKGRIETEKPRGLIKIDCSPIRLCETTQMNSIEYATLSHC